MAGEGVELLAGLDQLAVMGFVEVARRLPFFVALERRIRRLLDPGDLDLVIPIDYPGLNLRVARAARKRGIPVLYYISPQVWAWKPGRARRLARDVDHVAVILPFEVPILEAVGARVTFVGHPLLEPDQGPPAREAFALEHGLDPSRPLLALFPGSRRQELERHLDLFLEAARRVQSTRGDVQVAISRADSVPSDRYGSPGVPLVTSSGDLLRLSKAALVKSGTTTLEAALACTPFVVAYRTHPLTFALARRLVRVPHVALANLVAGEQVVPELLQDDATPERLSELLLLLLDEGSPERSSMLAGLSRVREALGTPGAAARVAGIAAGLLGRGEGGAGPAAPAEGGAVSPAWEP